jgi:hypothetical protein
MKKCLVCKKQIEESEEVCNECIAFFKWKYKNNFRKKLKQYIEYYTKTKFSGRNKMESYKCSCGAYTTNEDGICEMCADLAMQYEEESEYSDSL